MSFGPVCFGLLTILVATECGIVNLICKVKEDVVFEVAESILADHVQFRLYTPYNVEDFRLLSDAESIMNSNYNPYQKTIFIIHGYGSSPGSARLILLKDFLLMSGHFNVIIVDWAQGASEYYMPHAIRNAFSSAREVASFIELLVETSGTKLSQIHLIGFSLGAQLASFVGKRLNKVARITALDPAGPCFSLYGKNHKIHYTDAEFVDVIITNGDGFGLKEPSGHVNFVVNGGMTQSGCGNVVLQEYRETYDTKLLLVDACSHQRAVKLYIDSLNNQNCPFVGYSCSSYDDFLIGKCTDCGIDGSKCCPVGYKAVEYKPKIANQTKVFYLKAADESPYCLYHYSVYLKLNSSEDAAAQIGQLYITLEGSQRETQKLLTPYSERFEPGEEYRYLLTLPTDVGYLKSVKLLWFRTSGGPPSSHELYVDKVKVFLMDGWAGSDQSVFRPCGTLPLKSSVARRYLNERHTPANDDCL